jgi:hypothetical protein
MSVAENVSGVSESLGLLPSTENHQEEIGGHWRHSRPYLSSMNASNYA